MQLRHMIFFALLLSSNVFAEPEAHTGLWFKLQMDEWEKATAEKGAYAPKAAGAVGYYSGYIAGVAEALWGKSVCLPEGTTYDQTYAVVAKYLKNNPEKWNQTPFLLTSSALIEAFPCQKKRK